MNDFIFKKYAIAITLFFTKRFKLDSKQGLKNGRIML